MSASNFVLGNLNAREHVERIRRDRFFIGREEKNPLAEDMHQAVNYLSEELYSKDVHFLMELIQVYIYIYIRVLIFWFVLNLFLTEARKYRLEG